MNARIDQVIASLEQVTMDVRTAFGSLSRDQLNWKPAQGRWSIAQCLDHLIRTNRLYFPSLESLRAGPPTPTFWERYSPLSGLLGKILVRTTSPGYRRKMKTSSKAEPATSEIDAGIVERFARHQDELIGHLRILPSDIDRKRTIVTSPLLRWVTYSLDDCLTILAVHEERHLQQARGVMETEGFPGPA
ncbi:MAG: DinB family protein [Gemmatimonadota bacterium]